MMTALSGRKLTTEERCDVAAVATKVNCLSLVKLASLLCIRVSEVRAVEMDRGKNDQEGSRHNYWQQTWHVYHVLFN